MVFKRDIGVPMVLIQHHFGSASFFINFFKSKYIKQLISNGSTKICKDHGVSRFIDDLCAIIRDSEFLTSFKKNIS